MHLDGISTLERSVAASGYPALVLDRLARQACQIVESKASSIFARDRHVPGTAIAVAACGAHQELVGSRVNVQAGFEGAISDGAAVALPARWEDEVRGALTAHAAQGRRFDDQDLELLGELATTAGAALDHAERRGEVLRALRQRLGELIQSLDSHDGYTSGHSDAVVEWSCVLGERLRLATADLLELELGALLHDLGKTRVPGEVLRKPGPLLSDEYDLLRRHPAWGAEMIETVPGLEPVATIVRFHHERWDGSGYPDGLPGDRIPIASRIIAVCDAYHAMTSDRPYRKALPPAAAASELCAGAGRQFDPAIVECLVGVLQETGWPLGPPAEREAVNDRENGMNYILGERAAQDGTEVVVVSGEVDMNAVPELKVSVERALKHGAGTLIVDLSEATFIDSTAIGVLVGAHQRLRLAGGSLEIVCTEPNLLRVFEVVGLNRELSIHASEDAALRSFAGTH